MSQAAAWGEGVAVEGRRYAVLEALVGIAQAGGQAISR